MATRIYGQPGRPSSVSGVSGDLDTAINAKITATVPAIVDTKITATVPAIVDTKITASTPAIVNAGIAAAVGKPSLAVGEKLITTVGLAAAPYLTVTQPFNQNDSSIATTEFVKSRKMANYSTFLNTAFTKTSGTSFYTIVDHDGMANLFCDITLSAGTDIAGPFIDIASGMPPALIGEFSLPVTSLIVPSFPVSGVDGRSAIAYVTSAGVLTVYAPTIKRAVAGRFTIFGRYITTG